MTTFLTVREAAAYSRVSRATIYRLIESGDLPARALTARSMRIDREDLEARFRPVAGGRDAAA